MNREEKLGRALVKAYDGEVLPDNHKGYKFKVNLPVWNTVKADILFRNWYELLFGADDDFFREFQSLNYYLRNSYRWENTIEYSSLDELDLQLTLIGRNPLFREF